MNLMQSSFPLDPEPFAAARRRGGARRRRLQGTHPAAARRPDHPRDHADLRHPRARLLVDAGRRQGRRRQPAPRRQDHQLPPGRLPQLPARPRVQPLVHDRHAARLGARPGGDARGAPAADRRRVDPPAPDPDDVQDQHEPGDGGRHRRARRQGRGGPAARARAPALRRDRRRRDPGAAGTDGGRRPPLRRGRRRGRDVDRRAARPPARR